ncbi:tetratricopeptide repeat protein [Eikenella halliae]|uniref:tetratricopeptide repeat protein n=1 Tax=Eikenella halliae TaxID=1795832 RepID=UPI0028D2AE3C|nr:tetratricopeptide repeat protein [Eikenella halliae]
MRGNRWKEAVPWYEKAAAQGHAKAQNNLGVAYSEGRGVAVDKEKACQLFEQAHKQLNSRDSLENVALCNDQTGKPQNAFESYLSAAEQGSPSAMRLVGQMYDSGEGTAQSYEWAVYWYRQAVLRNDAQAMYLLASKYAQYQGVPKREPANAVSAYLLLKSIKMYQKPEDAQALAGLGIDERIRAFEQIMPPQMRAKLPGLEAAIRRDGTKGLLEGIDGAIPYQAPQTRP